MALFKISNGSDKTALDKQTKTEGHCWYTYEDSKFYIDYKDSAGIIQRQPLNAAIADNLTGKNDLIFYDSTGTQVLKIAHESGNITGQYLTGTWLQTTDTSDKAGKFATIDNDGWIYYRLASEAKSDMGIEDFGAEEVTNAWNSVT